jgi:RNA polymerase sigma factor (sigma-70 family)
MPAATANVIQQLRRAVLPGGDPEPSDGQLLESFLGQRDEAAFGLLVRRHGPMVFGVCKRVIGNSHDAEDAFQATFLVLARKAAAVTPREAVGNWLYGVAYRTARRARALAVRHRAREKQVKTMPQPTVPPADDPQGLEPILDEELNKLPDKYRLPLVLFDLEGRPRKEVARHLKLPEGTLSSRLARARRMLAQRLRRRGVVLPGGSLAMVLGGGASACVPLPLVSSTIKAVAAAAAGGAATAVISTRVAALTQGVLKAMFLTKLKVTTAALLVAGLLVCGLLSAGWSGAPNGALGQEPVPLKQLKPPTKAVPEQKPDDVTVAKPGAKIVHSLAYCNDGKTVALLLAKGEDPPAARSVVLWDVRKGKVQQTLEEFDKDAPGRFYSVTASKDGTTIAVAAGGGGPGDGAIKVWDARTGKLVRTFELKAQVPAFALSRDGNKLIGGAVITNDDRAGKLFVWDVKTGEVLQTLEADNMLGYYAAAISDDGKWIAGAGFDYKKENGMKVQDKGKVVIWEAETGTVKQAWTDGVVMTMSTVAFSPDGKLVAAGGLDKKTIPVWDTQTGKLKHELKPEGDHAVLGLAFSPDGKTLASVGLKDARVWLWDLATGKARETLEGHRANVFCVAFSPDGRTLATGGDDGTLRFWPIKK